MSVSKENKHPEKLMNLLGEYFQKEKYKTDKQVIWQLLFKVYINDAFGITKANKSEFKKLGVWIDIKVITRFLGASYRLYNGDYLCYLFTGQTFISIFCFTLYTMKGAATFLGNVKTQMVNLKGNRWNYF